MQDWRNKNNFEEMRILITGYGKMGRMVEELAAKEQIEIAGIIDSEKDWLKLDIRNENGCNEVTAIDFSTPSSVLDNIEQAWKRNIPIVVGTTGWYDRMDEIKKECLQRGKTLFWASNFSIGVFLFDKVNACLASMMKDFKQYNPSITEIHHIHKLDAPSGTAISLARTLIENCPRKKQWKKGQNNQSEILDINSIREGEVCGTHIINYSSPVDEIEIKHCAKNRQGFALGALTAARWIENKKGFFTMSDMIQI